MENSCGGVEFAKEFLQKFYTFDRTLIVLKKNSELCHTGEFIAFPPKLGEFPSGNAAFIHTAVAFTHKCGGRGKKTMEEILLMLNGFLRENDT